ncbi:hypothetical protein CS369_09950 [Candidatus Symbiopectobacterium sp. 'North America']|nr:hypothetical protein [Candidatus Symbiopectobacterium sp. 'North America']
MVLIRNIIYHHQRIHQHYLGRRLSIKLIKKHIVLSLVILDASICGKRKEKGRITSEYNVTSKKNSIIPLNDYSKIHIQFPIVEHYA